MAAKIRMVENTKKCKLVISCNLLEIEDHGMHIHKDEDEEAKVVDISKKLKKKKCSE